MDRRVVEQKLESLRRCLIRIEAKCPPDWESLASDPDLQDILTINLTRAVQLCVDIGTNLVSGLEVAPPNTMGETFDVLADAHVIESDLASQLKKAVGFRNIAVHNYEEINWRIVHSIARDRRGDFDRFAREISARLGT